MNILDQFKLDRRVSIVTGASSGIGKRVALAYAEAGARVAFIHSSPAIPARLFHFPVPELP